MRRAVCRIDTAGVGILDWLRFTFGITFDSTLMRVNTLFLFINIDAFRRRRVVLNNGFRFTLDGADRDSDGTMVIFICRFGIVQEMTTVALTLIIFWIIGRAIGSGDEAMGQKWVGIARGR